MSDYPMYDRPPREYPTDDCFIEDYSPSPSYGNVRLLHLRMLLFWVILLGLIVSVIVSVIVGWRYAVGFSTVYLEHEDCDHWRTPAYVAKLDSEGTGGLIRHFSAEAGDHLFEGADTYGKRLSVCLAEPEIAAEYAYILDDGVVQWREYWWVRDAYMALCEERYRQGRERRTEIMFDDLKQAIKATL